MILKTATDIVIKLNDLIPEYTGKWVNLFIWTDKLIHISSMAFDTQELALKEKESYGDMYIDTIQIKGTIEKTIQEIADTQSK